MTRDQGVTRIIMLTEGVGVRECNAKEEGGDTGTSGGSSEMPVRGVH